MFQTIHYVMICFGSLAMGLPQLTHAFPPSASPWILGASSVCALIATVLGAVSGSAGSQGASVTTTVTQIEKEAAPRPPAGFARVPALFIVIAVLFTAPTAISQGCHASAGQLEQTAADAEHLGGCIIGTVLNGQTDPGVLAQTCAGALPSVIVDVISDFEAKGAKPGDGGLMAGPHNALLAEAKKNAMLAQGSK